MAVEGVIVLPQTLCPCQPAAAVPVKRYKRRMEQQIGNCVQDTTAPLLQKCSQLAAAGENTDKKTNEILEEAHNFVMQVQRSPCALQLARELGAVLDGLWDAAASAGVAAPGVHLPALQLADIHDVACKLQLPAQIFEFLAGVLPLQLAITSACCCTLFHRCSCHTAIAKCTSACPCSTQATTPAAHSGQQASNMLPAPAAGGYL